MVSPKLRWSRWRESRNRIVFDERVLALAEPGHSGDQDGRPADGHKNKRRSKQFLRNLLGESLLLDQDIDGKAENQEDDTYQ